jgi:hypothetical protein
VPGDGQGLGGDGGCGRGLDLTLAARVGLFITGWAYGAAAERSWNLLLAATVGLAVLMSYQAAAVARRRAGQDVPFGGVASAAGAALSLAAAALGAVTLVVPNAPTRAAAAACAGAPVYGARFFAQTVEALGGVNARSGPGTGYPQVNRFAAGCTLGFDGYCIGEPIGDFRVTLPGRSQRNRGRISGG